MFGDGEPLASRSVPLARPRAEPKRPGAGAAPAGGKAEDGVTILCLNKIDLIDEEGIVAAQGLVNTREHLESLFEAQRRGVASIQEYLREKAK